MPTVAIERHLAHCVYLGLAESTRYQRRRVLHRLLAAGTNPLTATAAEIEARLSSIPQPESRCSELSHLRGFYRWALEVELVSDDPTARLRRPKTGRRLPRPISEADLARALAMSSERVRPWLLLAGWAGLRAGEIASLRAEEVQWGPDGYIVVRCGKGGADRVVPLAPWLDAQLRRCDLPRSGWLFPRRDGQPGPVRAWTVSHLAARDMRDSGVDATLHQLRHRFGTQAQRLSRDLRVTQELMGHETPVSTAIYTRVAPTDLRATVAALPVAC